MCAFFHCLLCCILILRRLQHATSVKCVFLLLLLSVQRTCSGCVCGKLTYIFIRIYVYVYKSVAISSGIVNKGKKKVKVRCVASAYSAYICNVLCEILQLKHIFRVAFV